MKKYFTNSNSALISNNQTVIVAEPRQGEFNFSSFTIALQLSAILNFWFLSIFTALEDKIYLTVAQIFSQSITVRCAEANQALWAIFRSFRAIFRHFDLGQNFINWCYFARKSRFNGTSQRNILAVGYHHPPQFLAPFGFVNSSAHFFDGAELPSIKASSQSSNDCSSRSPRNLRHTQRHTFSSSSQQLKMLQHLVRVGCRFGKSFHLAPVRRISKMFSKTSRLPTVGLQTLPVFGFDIKSSFFFHCASFINRVYFAIRSSQIAYYT